MTAFLQGALVGLVVFSIFTWIRGTINKEDQRLTYMLTVRELDKKLDALIKNSGIQYDPNTDPDGDILYVAVHVGKIQAIKMHRRKTGMGLADSKKYVEALVKRSIEGSPNIKS